MRLTQDHKPTEPKEIERITRAGGRITTPSLGRPRVNSKLDMSRSIGDVELKQFGVSAEPDTRHIQVRALPGEQWLKHIASEGRRF